MNGWYFVLGVVSWNIIVMLGKAIIQEIRDRRMKRFIRLVSVTFPDNNGIIFIAVESSDKKALKTMMDDLRERFVLPSELYDFEKEVNQAPREGG